MTDQPPPQGKYLGWLSAVKGLTISNVLVVAMLAVIAVPVFVIYQAVTGNEELLNRLLSTYREIPTNSGCALRNVQERGGPDLWAISTGFAYRGTDRWNVSVIMTHEPTEAEIVSYCESLKLIADKMVEP
jgi:hypothetical protein